eukprot:scaffold1318_cov388-Prasinococcus_capsulatus_cf.AAC.76
MAKHHPVMKLPGIAIGRLCEKCTPWTRLEHLVVKRLLLESRLWTLWGRCVICGGHAVSDAYYCKECTQQEKDRDGCPKIINLGSAKTDLFYERKK